MKSSYARHSSSDVYDAYVRNCSRKCVSNFRFRKKLNYNRIYTKQESVRNDNLKRQYLKLKTMRYVNVNRFLLARGRYYKYTSHLAFAYSLHMSIADSIQHNKTISIGYGKRISR